jgi:hypothetical protein
MQLNGKDDYYARTLHGIVGLFLLLIIFFFARALFVYSALLGLGCGGVFFLSTYRLLKYAVTGKDCINNDIGGIVSR